MPKENDLDWTDNELRSTVRAYFQMLDLELREEPFVKAEFRRRLIDQELPARTEGAVEFRMQNISSVLGKLREPWIRGYKPAEHVGPSVEERLLRIIQEERTRGHPQKLLLKDICPDLETVQGVKAVFGPISSYVLCFAGRGEPNSSSFDYQAANAAQAAVERPFVIAIGGGDQVASDADGCVVSIARLGTVSGPTRLLLQDEEEIKRLARWPVSVNLLEVWHFNGKPHLVRDLGMPDRTILGGSQDGIIRPAEKMSRLWETLRNWPVTLANLPPPANFYDSGKPRRAGTKLPFISTKQKEEGDRVWKYQLESERDAGLRAAAKRNNFHRHGKYTCEACNLTSSDSAMFDAHHMTPLFAGRRITRVEHLLILCPTCHRRAHRSPDKLMPYSLVELRTWIDEGRP
ncbi:hypothetical protein HFO87_09300 [Rhizobium leguminosarum]|uniref:hypothetical protein n=1 Tax=Rhizobium leguminosarum TaxID=384 RepID=UPI001C95D439|nr:hypothetical protein [Rhizobium leguminosarum]MBY5484667.1 hypothetical protein [Rhizobium leguminosarum]